MIPLLYTRGRTQRTVEPKTYHIVHVTELSLPVPHRLSGGVPIEKWIPDGVPESTNNCRGVDSCLQAKKKQAGERGGRARLRQEWIPSEVDPPREMRGA